ncbi:MAG: glycosyltransferase family 2 protein [Proteobacteria bacterium]|nr:glycosyltransferase family 2 protein [Pseudomonadota bacterium]
MQAETTDRGPANWADRWLVLRVHCRALGTEPGAYLTAAWWRLRGKRVRSRNQFASLFGRSPLAYRLWQIRHGVVPGDDQGVGDTPPLVALIDAGEDDAGLDDTLRSLSAEGVDALTIGMRPGLSPLDVAKMIDWAAGPWLMPITAGDQLAPGAGAAYRAAAAQADAATRLIYADDDLLDGKGPPHQPHFKPGWNAELFDHFDYLSGASILRAGAEDLEACASSPDWAASLTRRIAARDTPAHLAAMLHRRRSRPLPRLPAVPQSGGQNLPPVSIIIPTRNRVDLLRTCLEGVAATDYPDLEAIIVDNGSDDPETLAYLDGLDPARHHVLRDAGPFNYAALNNRAAGEARGRLLCLLNNDVEITHPDWLRIMAVQAQRGEVGAVGARLLYPDGRIQHAGVVIGMGNAAGHAHRLLDPDEGGYFDRHSLPQFVSAVTGACLVVEKERFHAVGGFDEENFAVAFNDVDLCLRLNQRGWQSFYEPRATLIHHESVSRGLDRDPAGAARFAKELAALQRLWNTDRVTDPFHHPHLSRASEQFVVGL